MKHFSVRMAIFAGLTVVAGAISSRSQAADQDAASVLAKSETNPLYKAAKVKNYLPDMRWPEVEALMKRTDIVLIPVAALEQHGPQGPIGTDSINAIEIAKLIAQQTDVLVAPILMVGNSPYHMEFPGTVTLPEELIQEVYFQAAKSFIRQGWKRFVIYNGHGGNAATSQFIVDRINQQTSGIAVELGDGSRTVPPFAEARDRGGVFDEHAGVSETSNTMFLNPGLVDLSVARVAKFTYPKHIADMIDMTAKGDRTADLLMHVEALKDKMTGKGLATREMTDTGVWSQLDPKTSTAKRGHDQTVAAVTKAVKFIDAWKAMRPVGTK